VLSFAMADTTGPRGAGSPRLSPSDVRGAGAHAGGVELAGRVLANSGRAVVVGDAFAEVEAELAAPADLLPGDLVVLAGALAGGALMGATVASRTRPPRPTPARETDRLRAMGVGAGLRARALALRAVRSYFDERGFLEVETPAIVPSPGLDLHLDAFEVQDMQGVTGGGHLITSPEYQMKRLLAGGVPRCFQVCHCFRRGEVGRRHNPEFTMLEWYRAFSGVEAVLEDTEAIVRRVASALSAGPFLDVAGARVELDPPFERLAVGDAFARFAEVPADEAIELATRDEDRFFRLLVEVVEPALARVPRPVFLVDYPAPFASLARLSPRDPRVAERFELYVAGVELCNGFGELTDEAEQRARLVHDQDLRRRAGKPVYPIDERFLDALAEGMPPAGGNALGLDRLIAVCLGTDRIGDVTAFPVDWL
jgi:lysyl-tRNA synthetase class 2